ncbi:YjcZ family sporulation protein [Camelliibacillus cellulosilyticus]|uniref:YjcZ family sporulation protein n=1 Tax=Camelliibacillus cellulosilyticus TaxID=2174486 RepID=A0ABV9GPK3_9BACL
MLQQPLLSVSHLHKYIVKGVENMGCDGYRNQFVLIVVLFILLVIVGTAYF